MVAGHEEVDHDEGDGAEDEDEHHQPCGLAAVPAPGEAVVEEHGVEHPGGEGDDFLGVAGDRPAVDGAGVEEAADHADGVEGEAHDRGDGIVTVIKLLRVCVSSVVTSIKCKYSATSFAVTSLTFVISRIFVVLPF